MPLLSQPCFLCAAPSQIQAWLRPGHLYKDIPQAFQAHTVTPNPTSSPESVSRFPRPSCLPRYPQHKHWIGLHLPTSPTCLLVLFPRNVSKIPPHFCYLHSCDVVLNLLYPPPWTVPLVVQPLPRTPNGILTKHTYPPHALQTPHPGLPRPGLALQSLPHPCFRRASRTGLSTGPPTSQRLSHLQALALAFPAPCPALAPCPVRPQKGIPRVLLAQQLGAGKWVCAGSLTQYVTSTPPLPFLRSAWPALSTSRTISPAAPPVFFPPSKPLQNLTTVACSAAATLHGHHLMLTVSHSSENPNHTVVCRALGSLVPVGCLAVCPTAPLPAQFQSRPPPCCPGSCQGCSQLAAFVLHPLPEKLFPVHFIFVQRAPSREDVPARPCTPCPPCSASSEHLSHLTVCM